MPPKGAKAPSTKDGHSSDVLKELTRLKKLEKTFNARDGEIEKLKTVIDKQEVQIQILRGEFKIASKPGVTEEGMLQMLREQNELLNLEMQKLQKQIEEVGGVARDANAEVELKKQVEELHKELTTYKEDNNNLKSKQQRHAQIEKENTNLKAELARKQKADTANERMIEELNKDKQNLLRTIEDKNQKIERYTKKVPEILSKRNNYQKDDSSLQQELADKGKQVKKLEADLNELRNKQKETSERHSSEIEELKQQLLAQQQKSGAETNNDQLPDDPRVKDLEQQLNDERKRCQELVQEKERLHNAENQRCQQLEDENKRLQEKLKNEEHKLAGFERAQESTESDLQTANNQIEKLKEDVKSLEKTKQDLEQEKDTLRKQKAEYEKIAKDATERVGSAKADASRNLLEKQLRDKEAEVKSTKSKLESECNKWEAKVNKLEIETRAQKERISELQKNHHEALENLTKKDLEIQQLKDDQKISIARKEETINKLRKEKSSLESSPSNNIKGNVDELRQQLRAAQEEIKMLQKSGGGSQNDLKQQLRAAQEENNNLKNRLSKVVGAKISDDNPNIADLSDENRPTKLGEKYSELYDNEWTDAYEEIEAKVGSENKVIETLRTELTDINKYCKAESEKYTNRIKQSAMSMQKGKELVQVDVTRTRQLKDLKKSFAPLVANDVYESYKRQAGPAGQELDKFRKKCVEVCWLMSVQDPPVVLDDDVKPKDNKFDSDRYRSYTKGGNKLDYVVWPPMLLHKGGAMLCKGVAQGK